MSIFVRRGGVHLSDLSGLNSPLFKWEQSFWALKYFCWAGREALSRVLQFWSVEFPSQMMMLPVKSVRMLNFFAEEVKSVYGLLQNKLGDGSPCTVFSNTDTTLLKMCYCSFVDSYNPPPFPLFYWESVPLRHLFNLIHCCCWSGLWPLSSTNLTTV